MPEKKEEPSETLQIGSWVGRYVDQKEKKKLEKIGVDTFSEA